MDRLAKYSSATLLEDPIPSVQIYYPDSLTKKDLLVAGLFL